MSSRDLFAELSASLVEAKENNLGQSKIKSKITKTPTLKLNASSSSDS